MKSSDLSISGFGAVAFASGDAISIFGSGFDPNPDNNVVSFNGVNGEVALATANRLQVIAPLLATSGKITITVHGKSAVSAQSFNIVNVLQGTYTNSFTLTADKKYLIRGKVVFNSKLIIQAGTVIYGEKITRGSLSVNDIDFEGTEAKPIIFTSDQPAGSRFPGDWSGLIIGGNTDPTNNNVLSNGIFQYVRIEYAGYHQPGTRGTALSIGITPDGIYQYIQTSYSAGDGITFAGVGGNNLNGGFIHNIVAFGCAGDDFRLTGNGIIAQFGLGLKDPYYADDTKGNGIAVANISPNGVSQLTNFTLVGYNPDARNLLNPGQILTNNAGSGILLGNNYLNGSPNNTVDPIAVYNSVIAASTQAGVNFTGVYMADWLLYESTSGPYTIALRNNFITGTLPTLLPLYGGAFAHYQSQSFQSLDGGFVDIQTDPNRILFASLNDTTKTLSFSGRKDDLGIKTLTDYSLLNNPGVLPAAGSILLTSASFPLGSYADSPFFNKAITYAGAFGTQDWTRPWCNFNPQITKY